MNDNIAIKVTNLSKHYKLYNKHTDRFKEALSPSRKKYHKNYKALDNISFEIKKGEALGIIGRNGAGKSTLLKIITGVLTQTSGEVEVNGRIASLLELGAGFNPELTGYENIYFNASLLGLSDDEIDSKIDSIISFADIGEHIYQPVKTYSSGMYVRVAFAINVAIEPDILIVDEALAVGDALFQKRCYQHIEKIVENGTTLLFVSHEQETVRTLTQRAIFLKNGEINSIGSSSEIILDYRRLLHDEEKNYYKTLIKDVEKKQKKTIKKSIIDKNSFGDKEAEILEVLVLDDTLSDKSTFYSNEEIIIKVKVKCNKNLKNLNVGLRIRNKEGVKIYSWATLNQDIYIKHINSNKKSFWDNEYLKDDIFEVYFSTFINLGQNLYEIQTFVSYEEFSYYGSQHILDWKDESSFFNVTMNEREYFFGGTTDMNMKARWNGL